MLSMKTKNILAVVIFAVSMMIFISACEDAKGTRPLGITPVYTILEGVTNAVALTVNSNDLRELSLPLEWWEENPALGRVTQSGGVSALYSATGAKGINVVWVRDQYGAEGSATIEQR